MRAQQWDHMHAVCFITLSHMITIMAIAVQRQRVAEVAIKTLSYEDISIVLSK